MIWFNIDTNNLHFTINTDNISYAGDHSISIVSSYSALSFTDTTATIVTFIVPCNLTTWAPNSITNLATSIDVPYVYSFTQFSVISTNCGSITYTLNPTLTFVSVNSAALTITVSTSNVNDIGSH